MAPDFQAPIAEKRKQPSGCDAHIWTAVHRTLRGSGGGIRTPDLWVMSPTSCRCSTPRQALHPPQRVRGVRGGLASRGVAPTVLSGAALGHDRVRDGSGWVQRALGHGCPSPAISTGEWPCALAHCLCAIRHECTNSTPATPAHPRTLHGHGPVTFAPGSVPPAGAGRPGALLKKPPGRSRVLSMNRCVEAPASAIRTAQLQSVTRCPPAAYQPGHLPGALLGLPMGSDVLRRGSRLDAFSGSPVRT